MFQRASPRRHIKRMSRQFLDRPASSTPAFEHYSEPYVSLRYRGRTPPPPRNAPPPVTNQGARQRFGGSLTFRLTRGFPTSSISTSPHRHFEVCLVSAIVFFRVSRTSKARGLAHLQERQCAQRGTAAVVRGVPPHSPAARGSPSFHDFPRRPLAEQQLQR